MKRYRQASRIVPLCLMALAASACSVDLSKLGGAVSSAADGAADLPVVSDLGGAGGGAEVVAADAIVADSSTLFSPDMPVADALAVHDDLKDVPGTVATEDATGSDAVADSSDQAAEQAATSVDAGDVPTGGGGIGSGGSGGIGSGGSGGIGSFSDSGGVDATNSNGGAGDASSGGSSAGTGGNTGGIDGSVGTGGAGVDPDLVLWYKFDESSGTIAADSSSASGGVRSGTLGTAGSGGSATFSTDHQVGTHALSLATSSRASTPAGGYVTVPAPEALAPGALTIAVWIKLSAATSAENWERIFDFGNGSTGIAFLYLTARASDSPNIPVRFGISNSGHTTAAEQRLETQNALVANEWHHIAIVLPAGATYTGALYMDGVLVATNKTMTLHLSDVGTTTLNWLGRSPFSSDPFYSGSLDDLRIYKRDLSAAEIGALVRLP